MNFRIGQKVVCVDDELPLPSELSDPCRERTLPQKGIVYTIRAVGLINPRDPKGLPCVLLEELKRNPDDGIWAHRFRPVVERKTDISIFTEILGPQRELALTSHNKTNP